MQGTPGAIKASGSYSSSYISNAVSSDYSRGFVQNENEGAGVGRGGADELLKTRLDRQTRIERASAFVKGVIWCLVIFASMHTLINPVVVSEGLIAFYAPSVVPTSVSELIMD
uniref:Uncharacterized protein n=1 Tax=Vespula pensylvanica TaxID=30213 RepID=A0A834N729_VESPE|nr:hypothetical protein H0235_016143 [Vespula pensylvanica]